MISFHPLASLSHDTVPPRDLVSVGMLPSGLRHIYETPRITFDPECLSGGIYSKGPIQQDSESMVVSIGSYFQTQPDEVSWGVYFGLRSWYNKHGTGSDDFKVARDDGCKVASDDEFKVSSDDEFKVAIDDDFKVASDDEFKVDSDDEFKVAIDDFKVASPLPDGETLDRDRNDLAVLGGEIEALTVALQTIDDNQIIEINNVRTIFFKCASTYLQMKLTEDCVDHEPWFPKQEPPQLAVIRNMMKGMVASRDGGLVFKFWYIFQRDFRSDTVHSAQ
ncbi:hypothetical protein V8C35DRAFT_327255 [Trichoderma chlorosporum]